MSNEEVLAPVNLSLNKKKRNLPGRPDPEAEVIALSPRSLLATNRFICEICNKGFQRDQNLQLHRRGHNLPWRLKQKESYESRKKVYICPEPNCVHHDPARALGDLTGIKKHFSRKHGEKKWKCDKCSKRYAVQSDWKAHQKTCGTREYRCDCGTLFSRKDSFITHRAFCNELAVENENAPGSRGETEKPEGSLDNSVHDDPVGRRDCSAPMEAASSPKSQLTGDPHAPTVLSERLCDPAIADGAIASLPSKWVQGGMRATSSSGGYGQGPGLSLCLGMGPGPGPPGASHAAGSETAMPSVGLSNSRSLSKPGFPYLSGSDSRNKHVPSVGAMGMLASLFSSSKCNDDASDVSNYADNYGCPALSSLGSLNAGLSTSIPSMMNDSIGPLRASLHHAAMSATAILQKAAQMGAKTSTPPALQNHGMGVKSTGCSLTIQATQKEAERDYNLSTVPACTKMRQTEGHSKVGAVVFREGIRFGSMNDSIDSMARGAQWGGLLHSSCMPDSFTKHDMGADKEQSSAFDCLSPSGDCMGRSKARSGVGPQRREEERKLLDFLGVGGASGAVSSTGIGHILSPRDLASITSLNAGIKVEKGLPHRGGKIG